MRISRWHKAALCVVGLCTATQIAASGIFLHIFMADRAVEKIQAQELHDVLNEYEDVYRSGSIFADSGYLAHRPYGEEAHWSPFLNAYKDLVVERCSDAKMTTPNCRKSIAQLCGFLAHTIGDINFDGHFVTAVAEREFGGDVSKAQELTDTTIDFVAIQEQARAKAIPRKVVPAEDLAAIFDALGVKTNATEIRSLTAFQYWILLRGQVPLSKVIYPRLKQNNSWAYSNYLTAPGGVEHSAEAIAAIWDELWQLLLKGEKFSFYEEGGWPKMTFGIRKS